MNEEYLVKAWKRSLAEEALLNGIGIKQRIKNEMLAEAVLFDDMKEASALIKIGANVNESRLGENVISTYRVGLIHLAIMNKENSEEAMPMVKLLLEANADPEKSNIRFNAGNTALHEASQKDFIEVAKILILAGANPKIKNSYDKTPLDLARSATMKSILNGESDLREKVKEELRKAMQTY